MIASRLIAHRGCARLAPENTLGAMRLTQQLGVQWVEIDANLMGDGTVVIFHDDTLSRLTSNGGELISLSFDDVAQLDVGSHFSVNFQNERISTLDEMLQHLSSNQMGLNLEIKRYDSFTAQQIVAPTLTAIEKHWEEFNRLIISSFDHEILSLIHQAQPNWQLGQLWETLPDDWQKIAQAINAASIHLDHTTLTQEQANEIKQAGFDLYVYTVNHSEEACQLFAMGVDGIFTDDPTLHSID